LRTSITGYIAWRNDAFVAPLEKSLPCRPVRRTIQVKPPCFPSGYVEAARAFAERIVKEGGTSPADRLTWAYRQALSRPPRPEEATIVLALFQKHRDEYSADTAGAQKLVATGLKPVPQGMSVAELAAWTSVARVILNLHETITRN
jgi:hypothetical protein